MGADEFARSVTEEVPGVFQAFLPLKQRGVQFVSLLLVIDKEESWTDERRWCNSGKRNQPFPLDNFGCPLGVRCHELGVLQYFHDLMVILLNLSRRDWLRACQVVTVKQMQLREVGLHRSWQH